MRKNGTPITDELREALRENPEDIEAIVTAIEKVEQETYRSGNELGDALRGVPLV